MKKGVPMKKLVSLASVLALAACGGGSGGGNGMVVPATTPGVAPVTGRSAVSEDVVNSNKQITTMASEILVGNGSKITPSISRHASLMYNGQQYESYRLDDVEFKFGGEDSLVKFELNDQGQIIALTKMDRVDNFTGAPQYGPSQEGRFARTGNTAFTKNLYVYGYNLTHGTIDPTISSHFDDLMIMADVNNLSNAEIKAKLIASINKEMDKLKASQPDHNNDDAIEAARNAYIGQVNNAESFGAPEELHATLDVQGINSDLRFADLGFAKLVVKDTAEDIKESGYTPYVGGYDILKINPDQLAQNTVYEGVAIAGLDHKKKGWGSGTDVKEGVLVKQNNATLTINTDNSSSLLMDNLVVTDIVEKSDNSLIGKKWYTVQIDVAANGDKTFKISGTNNVTGYDLPSGALPAAGKTFTSADWKAYEQEYVKNEAVNPGEGARYSGNIETNVYGRDTGDTEATARFNFGNEEYSDGNTKHEEVAIYGAFGGGVQPQP